MTLTTRRAGLTAEHGVRWESEGAGDYTLETVDKPGRGTEIVLHLRDDADEFLSDYKIKSVIRTYSDHITLPIVMKKTEWKDGVETPTDEDETVNRASALWARPKKDVTEDEYNEFYKHVAHDFEPPLAWSHNRSKASRNTSRCCMCPPTRRSTSTTATAATASSSTCAASSSWTTPSS